MLFIGQWICNIIATYHPSEQWISQNWEYFDIYEKFILNLHINSYHVYWICLKFHLKEFMNSLKGKHDLQKSLFLFWFLPFSLRSGIKHYPLWHWLFPREEIHMKVIQFLKSRKNRTSTEIQSYPWDYTVQESGI